MRYFLAIAQTATALFFRRLCALLSFCILSIFLSISSASAQFLSDGVTPVTPIPSIHPSFTTARTACLNESAVTGRCQTYGDTSGYGDMENWDTSLVTDMSSAFNLSTSFNGDISGWDTSAVTIWVQCFLEPQPSTKISVDGNLQCDDMAGNVRGPAFNQDLSQWHTSNVTNMGAMFEVPSLQSRSQQMVTSNVTNMVECSGTPWPSIKKSAVGM